jgi:hypothetical protein
MDWITLSIEAVGIVIAILWTIVPAREFIEIFRRLRQESRATLPEPAGGFEPVVHREGRGS